MEDTERLIRIDENVSQIKDFVSEHRAHQNATITLGTGATVIMQYQVVDFDTHSGITTGAAWKYTAPDTGYYRVTSQIFISGAQPSVSTYNKAMLYKNGARVFDIYYDNISVSYAASVHVVRSGTAIVQLNKNEYIDVRAYQTMNASLTTDGDVDTYIEVERIR